MPLRDLVLSFFAQTQNVTPEPRASCHASGTLLRASPLYAAAPLDPPSCDDHARVVQHWCEQREHYPDLTWPNFIANLDQRRRFYSAERREREAQLAALQSQIKPLL